MAQGVEVAHFATYPTMSISLLLMPWLHASTAMLLTYRQFSNIRCTQSQNINGSRLILQLSLPNPLKPGVKLRMKM